MGWVKRLADHVIQDRMGQADLEFAWSNARPTDPTDQAKMIDIYVRDGIYTVNEARDLLGLLPVAGGERPMFQTSQGPMRLDVRRRPIEGAPNGDPRRAGISTEHKRAEATAGAAAIQKSLVGRVGPACGHAARDKDERSGVSYERYSERSRRLRLGQHAGDRWRYRRRGGRFVAPRRVLRYYADRHDRLRFVQCRRHRRPGPGRWPRPDGGHSDADSGHLERQTPVTGVQSFERLLYGVVSGASPNGPLSAPTSSTNTTLNGRRHLGPTSITVNSHTGFPSSVNYYIAVDTGANFEIMQVTAGQGTKTWTVVRGVSGPNAGVPHGLAPTVYLMPQGDVAAIAHTAISGHTAQTGSANHSGTTPPLMKLQSGDGATVSAGMIIRTTAGTGSNQIRMIVATSGYGTDVVSVNRDWSMVPDATTVYNVSQGMLFETGFASSGASYGDPNPVTTVIRCFSTAAADVPTGSARYFFEKVFIANNNPATALTGAQIEIASETPTLPSGALLDRGSVRARSTTPTPATHASSRRVFFRAGVDVFDPARFYQRAVAGKPADRVQLANATGAQGCGSA